tara:strand:+ start:144 stop:434 length:291 start_codon:yes stop_codon:yes gene_type:complete
MTSEDTDFRAVAVLSTRTLYFISNWVFIINLLDHEGSVLFPNPEYTIADSLFYCVPFGIISVFSMMFTIRNCNKLIIEFVVIGTSIFFGVWSSLPG